MRLIRLSSFVVLILLGACTTARSPQELVTIGSGVTLALPLPPSYPGQLTERTRMRITADGKGATVNVFMDLKPQLVLVRVTHQTGTTLIDTEWDRAGIRTRRSNRLPEDIRSEDLLAALYLAYWPAAQINASLPSNARFIERGPMRAVQTHDRTVLTIRRAANRILLEHFDFGYRFEIVLPAH